MMLSNTKRIEIAIIYAETDDLNVGAIQLHLDDALIAEKGGRAAKKTVSA